jgi:hypothetical protein
MFKAHEKYLIRHKILEYLAAKSVYYENGDKVVNLNDTNMSFHLVCEKICVPYEKAFKYHHALHVKGEEHVLCTVKDGIPYIGLLENGVAAAIDEYWLREGQKELNERVYDKTKWIVPVIALIVTVASVLYSATQVQIMGGRVSKLEMELRIVQQQIKPFASTSSPGIPRK